MGDWAVGLQVGNVMRKLGCSSPHPLLLAPLQLCLLATSLYIVSPWSTHSPVPISVLSLIQLPFLV
jgi:hypothetical protein